MSQLDVKPSFEELRLLLEKVANAVENLRNALEANNVELLPEALNLTNQALELINSYPGGASQLKENIAQFPEEQRVFLSQLLNDASINHQINGDLIHLAMQRGAAMQSFVAQQAPSATYDSGGTVPGSIGGVLSRKV
jgi:flagellar biosynthesis/type III secretory pathway chaperone